jgi:S-(hydroxymethyl)glutathione dehydrogenase/alcohol dehydrogenase
MSWAPQCGQCFHCLRGEGQHCEEAANKFRRRPTLTDGTEVAGVGGIGTFSEEMQTNEIAVVPVDTDLPFEQLALIGCGVATGVGAALWTAEVRPGSTVCVIGAGGVGLSVVQGAAIAGAARILVIDPLESKRAQALAFGATEVFDPAAGDVVEQVKERTGGRGVDVAFEVVGVPELIRQAFDLIRPRGTAVVVGMPRHDATVTVPVLPLFKEEKRLVGSFYGSAQVQRDFPLLVQLAESGRLDLASMVSQTLTLPDATAAFDAMTSGQVIRSVLLPG